MTGLFSGNDEGSWSAILARTAVRAAARPIAFRTISRLPAYIHPMTTIPAEKLDKLVARAQELGARGLVWVVVEPDGTLRSPVAKFLSEQELADLLA